MGKRKEQKADAFFVMKLDRSFDYVERLLTCFNGEPQTEKYSVKNKLCVCKIGFIVIIILIIARNFLNCVIKVKCIFISKKNTANIS